MTALREQILTNATTRGWRVVPMWSLVRRVSRKGREDAELLSVYRDHGVVPKSSRDDNHNTESDDLGAYQYVAPGNLVLNKMKTWQGSLAVSSYAGIVSPAYFVCEVSDHVDGRYLHHLLRSNMYIALYASLSKGIRPGQWDLPFDEFRMVPVPTPPLDTQRRIAKFLDDQVSRIDEAVGLRRQQIQAIAERQSLYARRVTTLGEEPDAAETGIEWMPYISRSWSLPKVPHVFRTGSGSTPPSEERSYYDGGIPWVNTGDVKDGHLTETAKSVTQKALDTFSTLRRYDPGALVVAMYGQGTTKGRVAILETSACVNQACCVLSADERAMSKWAFYWFRSHKEHIVQLAMGAGQPNLSQEIIRSLRIPMPPASTRGALLVELEAHESATHEVVSEMTAQVDLLQERKRSLITAAVTGEFDVTTASGRGV